MDLGLRFYEPSYDVHVNKCTNQAVASYCPHRRRRSGGHGRPDLHQHPNVVGRPRHPLVVGLTWCEVAPTPPVPSPSSSAGVVKVVAAASARHRVCGNPSLPAPPLRPPTPRELVPAAAAYACRPPVHRRCILRHPRCRPDLDVVVVAVNPISPSSGLAVVTISTRPDDAGTCLAVSCAAAGGLAFTADVCGSPLPGFLAAPPGTPRWAPAGLRRVAPGGAPTPPPPGGRIPPSPSTSSLHRLPPSAASRHPPCCAGALRWPDAPGSSHNLPNQASGPEDRSPRHQSPSQHPRS
ncbi:hypothetical protein OsI_30104 [Oryza sativa Indica Group]|uniref:Uncharacterized protein n=1 Tax=Oryza sativa subsp. indica TaxID=39946 RepID=B8B974_ORYSI|nr:hypothetical protein OsI_30104 [Oryza sativa Indica Group]